MPTIVDTHGPPAVPRMLVHKIEDRWFVHFVLGEIMGRKVLAGEDPDAHDAGWDNYDDAVGFADYVRKSASEMDDEMVADLRHMVQHHMPGSPPCPRNHADEIAVHRRAAVEKLDESSRPGMYL